MLNLFKAKHSFNPSLKGHAIERKACAFLKKQGCRLVHQNFSASYGEIDLIMHEQSQLLVIEVRYRANNTHGRAEETVDHAKQKKIIRTTQYFLQKHPKYQHVAIRFDIVSARHYNGRLHFEWIKDAFGIKADHD